MAHDSASTPHRRPRVLAGNASHHKAGSHILEGGGENGYNAIAHGHYGICDLHPDILVWMNTETYIDYHMMFLTGAWIKATREKEGNEFARRLFYYRNSDLERLLKDIDYLSKMWVDAINWLRSPMDIPGPFARETKYRQLCDQPRIAEALQIRRQKNS